MTKRAAGLARIRWNHPLAYGLVGAWLFNEGAGPSVAPMCNPNDTLTLTSGSTGTVWLSRPGSGIGIGTNNPTLPGSGGGAKLTSPSAAMQPSDFVSCLWFGTILGAGNRGNNPGLVAMGYAATNTSPFIAWGILRKAGGTGTDLLIADDYGGVSNSFTVTGAIPASSATPTCLSASFKSGSQIVYVNGIQAGSAAHTGSLSYSSPTFFVASDYSNEDPAVLSSMVLVWHRVLSAAEHLALASNPFQILVPLARPPRAPIAAAPPVPYPLWWTDIQMPQLLPQ